MGLLVASTPGTVAQWQSQQTVLTPSISTGDLRVQAYWDGGSPVVANLFPGQTSETLKFEVATHGDGTNLAWRLQVVGTVAASFAPYVAFSAKECDSGTVIPAGGYPAGTSLRLGDTVMVCAAYRLLPGAPSSLQGKSMEPKIEVKAVQVSHN